MKKIAPISGFPEWLPEQRLVELRVIDLIREQFELFGFAPVETRSVESLDVLLKKGETDKEIYVLRRLQAEESEANKEVGLPFDLTVPFSRYVAQYRGQLTFPFKRYQIQKVWRGERPKEGRFREFYQADVDVIAENSLPLSFDIELPRMLHVVLSALPIPPVRILINNRKLLQGAYESLGIADTTSVLRIVDKLDKIGDAGVAELLRSQLALKASQSDAILAIAKIQSADASFAERLLALGLQGRLLDEGINELTMVMDGLQDLPRSLILADLHIARGLDYYTGTVYEGVMLGHEQMGAVCSGGRYDTLIASDSVQLPGIGVSIGISRILGRLFGQGQLASSRKTPTCVLVAVGTEAQRDQAVAIANLLRARGVPTEVYHESVKFDKQIRYATRKGIPFVWFVEGHVSGTNEVRDLRTGAQITVDPATWMPPEEDRRPRIVIP